MESGEKLNLGTSLYCSSHRTTRPTRHMAVGYFLVSHLDAAARRDWLHHLRTMTHGLHHCARNIHTALGEYTLTMNLTDTGYARTE